jgi:hypothetical protein
VTAWCQEHRHDPVEEQQKALNRKLQGHYQYYGRPTNHRTLWVFYRSVRRIWKKWLSRRTRGKTLNWDKFRSPDIGPRLPHSYWFLYEGGGDPKLSAFFYSVVGPRCHAATIKATNAAKPNLFWPTAATALNSWGSHRAE